MGRNYESSHNISKTKQKKLKKIISKPNQEVSVLAIDTGAFIDIVKLDENFTPDKREMGFRHSLRKIKRMVLSGDLRLVVTPTVLTEISAKINAREIEFLTNYCYHAPSLEDAQIKLINLSLARVYTAKNYVRHKKDKTSTHDAQILAEASSVGLCLLTENVKDLIDYGKYEQHEEKEGGRSIDIAEYNREQNIGGDHPHPPRPISADMFSRNFRSGCYSSDIQLEAISTNMLSSILV